MPPITPVSGWMPFCNILALAACLTLPREMRYKRARWCRCYPRGALSAHTAADYGCYTHQHATWPLNYGSLLTTSLIACEMNLTYRPLNEGDSAFSFRLSTAVSFDLSTPFRAMRSLPLFCQQCRKTQFYAVTLRISLM